MTAAIESISTIQMLKAGMATFTISNPHGSRTFRIVARPKKDGPGEIYFVSLLTGPDNTQDYTYLGIYAPESGKVILTKKSRFTYQTECVRALQWVMDRIHGGEEEGIAAAGFALRWSDRCQRCGRELTVASSIDARLGPICAEKVMG